jgi:Tfp pilus assembly protein PilF
MNRPSGLNLIIGLILTLATVLVYGHMIGHQFVLIDDPVYVSRNPYVESGLTLQGVKWAFTTTKAEFWQPLTWLSYMLDTQLLGTQPRSYLFTNLLLHVINSIMVFAVFKRMTDKVWPSAFVAAFFALHPLHVESVVWIAERKDVLSALFWMLTSDGYLYYVENPGLKSYVAVCLLFTLGLMAKPMLVTLPFALLLLDFWPLGRFKFQSAGGDARPSMLKLIREKIPLLLITIGFSLTAFLAQKTGGGVASTEQFAFMDRIYNALISYTGYLWKMIWPHKLAVFYPFPQRFPFWQLAGALCGLVTITVLALKSVRRYPFLIVGWLWYLGTLVPVIGLIKIGDFAMADRYMYIPLIGPAVIIAWGGSEILAGIPRKKIISATAAVIVLAALSLATHWQVRVWSNSFTLFEHALKVTNDNFLAHYGLGHVYAGKADYDAAGVHFSKAVRINPTKATLYNDWGRSLIGQEKLSEAKVQFLAAHDIAPNLAETHFYLANILVIQKQFDRAVYHFSEALRRHPDGNGQRISAKNESSADYHELVSRYAVTAKLNQAIDQNQTILTRHPENLDALRKLIIAYSVKGKYSRAFARLRVDTSPGSRMRDIVRGYAVWKPVP